MEKKYKQNVEHYEWCFRKFGDYPKGVDWPNEKDLEKRYQVMSNIFLDSLNDSTTLLDFTVILHTW